MIFLRLFHHEPSPVPINLRNIVFKIIAPIIFFNVNINSSSRNIPQVLPTKQNLSQKENGQQNVGLNSGDYKENTNMETLLELLKALKKSEASEDEMCIKEWQTTAKVLDRLLFILNILSMVIAFGYGYTKLYTD